jgi:hypothetical protein
MSIGRKGCCWEERSKEGRTHECPWAEDRQSKWSFVGSRSCVGST